MLNDKQGAFTVDDEVAVADEGKHLIIAICVLADGSKHQLEASLVVGGLGVEGVRGRRRLRVFARNDVLGGEQVDVVAGHVVNEVEVGEADILGVEAKGVAAVLFSLEADGHLAHLFSVDDGVVLAFLREADLGVVRIELELRQLTAFAEADDGAVNELVAARDVQCKVGALFSRLRGAEGHAGVVSICGCDENAFHGANGSGTTCWNEPAAVLQSVVVTVGRFHPLNP